MYDIAFLIIFCLAVFIFLYTHRKNLKREGVMYLYRTQIGIKLINKIGTKYKKTLSVLSVISIISGYILMVFMVYFLFRLVYIYLFVPQIVRAIKIPPIMPLIPYIDQVVTTNLLPPFYFTYWIIAIAVIAIFHEFAHGIIAKRYGIKIKTTGFGFLGPFLAAFVEPDEKQMKKKPKFQQLAVLSAGTFTNLILAGLFFLLLSGFFILTYAPAGAMFNSYAVAGVNVSIINKIGNFSVNDSSDLGIINLINKNNITNDINFGVNETGLNLTTISVGNQTFFMDVDSLKSQLMQNVSFVVLYYDLPALRSNLVGTITNVDNNKITDENSLSVLLNNYHPGEKINITTNNNGQIKNYVIQLAENPLNQTKPIIGVAYMAVPKTSVLGEVYDFFNFFKESGTDYQPRYSSDFIIFIYNLIWWLALINLSVALMNMLPFAIFDGGQMFFLTIVAITKNEKTAQWAFKAANYIIVGIIILLMVGWALAVF